MDLAEFLLARIAEDEAVARAATPGPWEPASVYYGPDPDSHIAEVVAPSGDVVSHQKYEGGGASVADAAHIARWDPARVLAECAAKRAIVEEYEDARRLNSETHQASAQFDWPERLHERWMTLARIVRTLALPHADHPDYQGEWSPSAPTAAQV